MHNMLPHVAQLTHNKGILYVLNLLLAHYVNWP